MSIKCLLISLHSWANYHPPITPEGQSLEGEQKPLHAVFSRLASRAWYFKKVNNFVILIVIRMQRLKIVIAQNALCFLNTYPFFYLLFNL